MNSQDGAKTPSFLKHPKRHLFSCCDHLHHTNIAYAHQLIVYISFDFILLQLVTVFVFAVIGASLYEREQ